MTLISDLLRQTGIERREAETLLAFVLHKDRPFILAHASDALDMKAARRFRSLIKRREKHEPMAYLTGIQPFHGHDFLVDKHVLIPRPETETLVDLVLHHLSSLDTKATIVDVGTGSGCLALTFALEYPDAAVVASDSSDAALKVARRNARRLGAKVEFVKENLLGPKLIELTTLIRLHVESPLLRTRRGQSRKPTEVPSCVRRGNEGVVFVANLPYLPSSDKQTMMTDVVKFEPSKALFAGTDGTDLIVNLMRQVDTLDAKVSMFLEIDPRQADKLTALARQLFPKHRVIVERDLCGRERFLVITP